jgi:hypothetical protein
MCYNLKIGSTLVLFSGGREFKSSDEHKKLTMFFLSKKFVVQEPENKLYPGKHCLTDAQWSKNRFGTLKFKFSTILPRLNVLNFMFTILQSILNHNF